MWIKKNEKLLSHSNQLKVGVKAHDMRDYQSIATNNTLEPANIVGFMEANADNVLYRALRVEKVLEDIDMAVAYLEFGQTPYFAPIGFFFKKEDVEKYLIKHMYDYDETIFPQKYSIVPIPYYRVDYAYVPPAAGPEPNQFRTPITLIPANPSYCVVIDKGTAWSDFVTFIGSPVSAILTPATGWLDSSDNFLEDTFCMPMTYVEVEFFYADNPFPSTIDFGYVTFDVSMRDGIYNCANVIKIDER